MLFGRVVRVGELAKIYGPTAATESALQERDKVIEGMQRQIDELKQGKGYSKEDVTKMVEEYLAKR